MNLIHFFIYIFCSSLSATGLGGGGLYVIYLTLIQDVPQLTAQGMNLFFFMMGALASMVIHFRKRTFVFPLILVVSLFGTFGSLFGSFLAQQMDTVILSKIFGIMLIFCGIRSFFTIKRK